MTQFLRVLVVVKHNKTKDIDIGRLLKKVPFIVQLIFHDACNVNERLLQRIATSCTSLQRLHVSRHSQSEYSEEAMTWRCRRLVSVRFGGSVALSESIVRTMLKNLHLLQQIEVVQASKGLVRDILLNYPNINKFSCNTVHFERTPVKLSRHIAHHHSENQDHLLLQHSEETRLDWHDLESTYEEVHSLLISLPNITALSLSLLGRISNDMLRSIALLYPDLTSLCLRCNCAEIDDSTIALLASHCRGLTALEVQSVSQLSDLSVELLSHHCAGLTALSLSGCEGLTDGALAHISILSPRLLELRLNGCTLLTSAALIDFAAHCECLQWLDLTGGAKVTSAVVRAIALHCRNLHTLCIEDRVSNTDVSTVISDGCLWCVLQCCRNLQQLYLVHCHSVTDSTLAHFTSESLVTLSIIDNPHITSAAVLNVIRRRSSSGSRRSGLRFVQVLQCPRVNPNKVRRFVDHLNRITQREEMTSAVKVNNFEVLFNGGGDRTRLPQEGRRGIISLQTDERSMIPNCVVS
eukprot:gene23865-30141_t